MRLQEDSWGLLARDLGLTLVKWGVGAVALLWLAELPAARHLPGVAFLPRLSDKPLLGRLPTAAHVFGVKVPPAHHAGHPAPSRRHDVLGQASAPTARPRASVAPQAQAARTPAPAVLTSAPAVRPPAPAVRPPAPVAGGPARTSSGGVRLGARLVNSVPVQVVTVDLLDPRVVGTVSLANNASRPNAAGSTRGDEPFEQMVKRLHAAAVINGTFFSKDAEKRVMGNMVRDGALIKFSQWERGGTTFSLEAGNRPAMVTGGVDTAPSPWDRSWLAVTAGPRLLRNGVTWCRPTEEGFKDPHVLGSAGRSALGFDQGGRRLYLVSFEAAVTLTKAAEVMRAIGCREAMNLDGGASRSLAVGGRVVVPAGRALTNVLAFYDRRFPAPRAMAGALAQFRPEAAADVQ